MHYQNLSIIFAQPCRTQNKMLELLSRSAKWRRIKRYNGLGYWPSLQYSLQYICIRICDDTLDKFVVLPQLSKNLKQWQEAEVQEYKEEEKVKVGECNLGCLFLPSSTWLCNLKDSYNLNYTHHFTTIPHSLLSLYYWPLHVLPSFRHAVRKVKKRPMHTYCKHKFIN